MEAEFEQLWPQMADYESHSEVHNEILGHLKPPSASAANPAVRITPSISDALTGASLEYLAVQMVRNTYPSLQITRLLTAATGVAIAWRAVQHSVELLKKTPTSMSIAQRLVVVLVHIDWPDEKLTQIRRTAFPLLDALLDEVEAGADGDASSVTHFWLCWLSQPHSLVLLDYLQHMQTTSRQRRPRSFSFSHAFQLATCAHPAHFIADILSSDTDDEHVDAMLPLASVRLRAVVCAVRQLNVMQIAPFDETALQRLSDAAELFADNNAGLTRLVLLELCRLCRLQQKLYYHVANLDVTALAGQFSVLDYMSGSLSLGKFDGERARAVLLANRTANRAILQLPAEDDADAMAMATEVDIYEQFSVIRRLAETIYNRSGDSGQTTAALAQCKRALRNIRALAAFAECVEACVVLLFLRWDHITHMDDLDRTVESGSESSATPPTAPLESEGVASVPSAAVPAAVVRSRRCHRLRYERHGFICGADCLAAILRMLRWAIAQRVHKDESDETVQRLAEVTAVIADGTWRLSLFRTLEAPAPTAVAPAMAIDVTIDVKRFLHAHRPTTASQQHTVTSTSSSDENDDGGDATKRLPDVVAGGAGGGKRLRRKTATPAAGGRINHTLPRRKPRKDRPFRKLTSGERSMSFSHSTENERRTSGSGTNRCRLPGGNDSEVAGMELAMDSMESYGDWDGRRCVISKMLGSAEHLVLVCMNRGDLKCTRQMIKNHSLERSPLAAELTFTESFNQTKDKLRPIFERLRLLHNTSDANAAEPAASFVAPHGDRSTPSRPSSPATTVDRIKRAAAIGLEISTITNTIARFATGTPVHLVDAADTYRMLHKYRERLPFLGLYQPGESLQATIVCDLLLSLATDVDIAANVFEVLQKLWPSTRGDEGDLTTTANAESTSSTKRGIGYMAFVQNAVDAMRQLQPNRRELLSMRSLLSDEFLVIDQSELADWLAREQMFEMLSGLDGIAVDQLDTLNGLQIAFKRVRTLEMHRPRPKTTNKHQPPPVVHLFARVNEFIQSTWRLMRFASLERRQLTSTEILQLDLYDTVGHMVLEQNCSPDELEGLLCAMNMNLVHVLAVNLAASVAGEHCSTTTTSAAAMESDAVQRLLQRLESTVMSPVLDTRIGGPSVELRRRVNGMVWSYMGKHNSILLAVLQRICGMNVEFVGTLDQLVNLPEMEQVSMLHDNNAWTAAMLYDFTTIENVCRMLERTNDYGNVLQVLRSIQPLHRIAHHKSTLHLQDWLIQRYLSQPFHDTGTDGHSPYQLIDHIANITERTECLLRHMQHIADARLAVRMIRSVLLHDNAAVLRPAQRTELQLWLRNVLVYERCTELLAAKASDGGDLYQPIVRNWLQLKQLSELRPARIVEVLFDADEFALCLQWSAIHPISQAACRNRDTLSDLVGIINRTIVRQRSVEPDLFAIVESLPVSTVLQIYHGLITAVHNVPVLRYLIDMLMQRDSVSAPAETISDDQRAQTHRVNVSLRIIELSASDAQSNDSPPWHLITTPLLIVEQYVMNARFEALTHIVAGLRPLLDARLPCQFCQRHYSDVATCLDRSSSTARSVSSASGRVFNLSSRTFSDSVCDEFVLLHNDFAQRSEHTLATDCVDALLRIYASKALDFRVIETHRMRRPCSRGPVADVDVEDVSSGADDRRSHATSVSTDSLANVDSGGGGSGSFCMPHTPPVRAMWTRDEDAVHCMCCTRAVFTMLTRRHHCRQCGRVVCHACSTRREIVAVLYADVPVRVCDDCQRQLEVERSRTAFLAALSSTSGGGTWRSTSSASPRPGLTRAASSVLGHQGPTSSAMTSQPAVYYWQFSGNLRHDELLRDEFSYEFAPSVSLCLSILALHSSTGPQCADFLLMHCGRFEALLRPLQPDYPNPEVDYALVTRMLHCLALAAKVRGGTAECDVVLENADIIRAVVQHRCEELLPMEPLGRNSFRKLRDALLLAEKWELALEVSLKRGFSTTSVMAAWGIACLKSGCFETAREKFVHCMSKPADTTDDDVFRIFACISYESQFSRTVPADLPHIKRPAKSPPLLAKIVSILESTCHTTQPDVMARAAIIRQSNTSLLVTGNAPATAAPGAANNNASSLQRRRKTGDIPCHEPAMSILHTLANLRHIVNGTYEPTDVYAASPVPSSSSSGQDLHSGSASAGLLSVSIGSNRSLTAASTNTPPAHIDQKRLTPTSRFYDECLYYLTAYANHNDIVAFLVKHRQTRTALKYMHYQAVNVESFVHTLFMPHVLRGRAASVVRHMCEMDETLLIWRRHIIAVCGHLERSGLLNSLYLLQLLFRDPVRASMTCVRFYERSATSYADLQAQAFHLVNAEQHLTKELDLCQWEEIRPVRSGSAASTGQLNRQQSTSAGDSADGQSVRMKWDSRTLNSHIGTIGRQLEITKFLANCELAGRQTIRLLPSICAQSARLPTLFGGTNDRVQLAVLVLICGANVTEGFGLAYRIIQDCRLAAEAVYMAAARHLARHQRLVGVEQLLECLRSNVAGSTAVAAVTSEQRMCDRIVEVAVDAVYGSDSAPRVSDARRISRHVSQVEMSASVDSGASSSSGGTAERELFDRLVRQVGDVGVRISCHIAGGQLKSAYLLAVQHNRMADVRRVMRRAELANQPMIRRLCEMKLRMME